MVKLYEANIKWIEDIIEIIMDNVSCDHQHDRDGSGKVFADVSYCLNDEQDVIKKCIEAIPEIPVAFFSGIKKDWQPTSENINMLPDPIRKYIHDIETKCDPALMVQENALLKDRCIEVAKKIKEMDNKDMELLRDAKQLLKEKQQRSRETVDLGWANGWTEDPQILKDCKKAEHPRRETNRDPSWHGLHTEVRCDICNYIYHYDSSG